VSSQNGGERLDRIRSLSEAREELLREFDRDFQSNWHIYLGRFQIPVRFNSTGFSWLYVGLDIAAFAFGVFCIFLGQSWRELGIGLIVGSMFAISAFVGQILSVQLNGEQHKYDLLWRDSLIQEYAARLSEINDQIRMLR
jgi:hypothetical protein